MATKLRCAIYTRKSSEEGLDQSFNSLHAQREACEAYVLSQAGEGWSALRDTYDDGGFSGGSMDRPGRPDSWPTSGPGKSMWLWSTKLTGSRAHWLTLLKSSRHSTVAAFPSFR